MKAVLHLPVAEQYPSRTATVDSFASNRTSGMQSHLKKKAGHPKVIGYGFHSHRLVSEGMPHELFRRLHRTRSDSPVWRSSDTNAKRGSWSAVQVGSIRSFWIPGTGSGVSAGKPRTDCLVCASIARAMLDATGIAERHWFPARSAAVSSLIAEVSSRRASVCISRRPLLWRRVIGRFLLGLVLARQLVSKTEDCYV